jgi:hypothetical protein
VFSGQSLREQEGDQRDEYHYAEEKQRLWAGSI